MASGADRPWRRTPVGTSRAWPPPASRLAMGPWAAQSTGGPRASRPPPAGTDPPVLRRGTGAGQPDWAAPVLRSRQRPSAHPGWDAAWTEPAFKAPRDPNGRQMTLGTSLGFLSKFLRARSGVKRAAQSQEPRWPLKQLFKQPPATPHKQLRAMTAACAPCTTRTKKGPPDEPLRPQRQRPPQRRLPHPGHLLHDLSRRRALDRAGEANANEGLYGRPGRRPLTVPYLTRVRPLRRP